MYYFIQNCEGSSHQSSLIIKMTDSLGRINLEFAKSMSEMLEQLDADSQPLSCLPVALGDKGSNNNFTIFKNSFTYIILQS